LLQLKLKLTSRDLKTDPLMDLADAGLLVDLQVAQVIFPITTVAMKAMRMPASRGHREPGDRRV